MSKERDAPEAEKEGTLRESFLGDGITGAGFTVLRNLDTGTHICLLGRWTAAKSQ